MIELNGKYAIAKVFTDVVDPKAISQVIELLNQPYVEGSKVRMMPDIHAGAGCTIGTTMTISDKVCPNLVGVDIGCGMETVKIVERDIDLEKLDNLIRSKIPSGFNIRDEAHEYAKYTELHKLWCVNHVDIERAKRSIGTLGGGNHFSGMGFHEVDRFVTVHNYIDTKNGILRKGAVSAYEGEKLLIPINMRDGSLICVGKGNPDWNYSAPHGAGRLMSRSAAKERFTVDEFKEQMQGIYTTSVDQSTIDECPMAYKPMEAIVDNIHPTADIVAVIKPIYNFKAGGG